MTQVPDTEFTLLGNTLSASDVQEWLEEQIGNLDHVAYVQITPQSLMAATGPQFEVFDYLLDDAGERFCVEGTSVPAMKRRMIRVRALPAPTPADDAGCNPLVTGDDVDSRLTLWCGIHHWSKDYDITEHGVHISQIEEAIAAHLRDPYGERSKDAGAGDQPATETAAAEAGSGGPEPRDAAPDAEGP